MKKVSILIPVHNEEKMLPLLYKELRKLIDAQTNYNWEVLFVNIPNSILEIYNSPTFNKTNIAALIMKKGSLLSIEQKYCTNVWTEKRATPCI